MPKAPRPSLHFDETQEEYDARVPSGRQPKIKTTRRSKEATAEASASKGRNFQISDLVEECQGKVEDWETLARHSETALVDALWYAFIVYRQNVIDGKDELRELYREHKIRVLSKKGNAFTPLIKLLFGRQRPPATVTRWSRVLELAASSFPELAKAEATDFREMVAKAGGVEACSKLSSQPTDRLTGSIGHDVALDSLLATGRTKGAIVKFDDRDELPPEDFLMIILEKTTDGYIRHKSQGMTPSQVKRALGFAAKSAPTNSGAPVSKQTTSHTDGK